METKEAEIPGKEGVGWIVTDPQVLFAVRNQLIEGLGDPFANHGRPVEDLVVYPPTAVVGLQVRVEVQ